MKIDLREKPEQKKQLMFSDVRNGQWFVSQYGDVRIRVDVGRYVKITDAAGNCIPPMWIEFSSDIPIDRILDHITGFEF